MKIKKLELVGFKSFVDRTVLHFDHDVLGIVGPNGCGKSNIVDAIRWCMGEQSARHLRGRSMEDVIFSGSETRAAQDFAEVTLTFENDAPDELPLEYKEYGEIAVTRRLYRTGESDYLVNKTSVRLRDITDLFLGTGAGTKAYSIVEQGKVGLIVSAKPEDRRLLIEEAAGITKFKSRKKQAEKKMELTQQNLLRVGDIVAEIERSLDSLKRQAAKAERYVAYRGELEDLQLHEASHRYLELVGWIKLEGAAVERLTEDDARARTEIGTRDAEIEATRLDVHAAEERLDAAQNASFAFASAVRAEEAAIERAKDRLAALAHREQQAEAERRQMAEQGARLAAERDAVAEEVANLEGQERDEAQRVAAEEATLAELTAGHRTADAAVTEKRQGLSTLQADIASTEAKLAGFQRRRDEMVARRGRLRGERESLDMVRVEHAARAQELARAIEDLEAGRATTSAERDRLQQRLGELKELIGTQDKALDAIKGELSRKRSRFGALEEMHARLEGVGAGAKALVGMRDECVVGLVADRVEAPPELTQALAGLLGSRLQDVVVRDIERGVSLLEELAQGRKGRATLVSQQPAFVAGAGAQGPRAADVIVASLAEALRFAPEDEALVRALVGNAMVVRDVEAARRLRLSGSRAVMVTLGGTVLHADGRIEGGQGDAFAAGMLESKREARELVEELQRLDALVTEHLAALQSSRDEIGQVGAALDRARHESHAREIALVTAQKDLQKAEGQLEGVLKRTGAVEAEDAELAKALDEANSEGDEAGRRLEDARRVASQTAIDLSAAEATLATARERLDDQRQALTARKVMMAGARERLAAASGTQTRLARSAEELRERVQRLEDELVANGHAAAETTAMLAAHEREVQVALDHSRAAEDELALVRTAFEELRAGLLDHEATLKEARARSEALRSQLVAHEMALREKQIAMQHLLGGVADKFRGLHLPRIVGDHHMRPAPDEVSRARIEELVRLIERMGSVNLEAMREHATAEERFTFYTTQKADLDKALADLTRAIQQMNRESRRLFEETFALVNERFRQIFPKMFRGGRAELRLTNPDDMLETGIDIVAQPPGKKLSSIELMSGGEKALTAVSLIFAIFQIKPSPFCILDEVDAPLDEANVSRYNDLIRSMTDRSQFILITHVKRTMQLVDVLYGVTMPEAGVSKIVSVRINDGGAKTQRNPAEGLGEGDREARVA